MTYFPCWMHFKVLVTCYTDWFLSRTVNSFLFHQSFWKTSNVCVMRGELFYEEIVFYYQPSTWSSGKNSINTNYHNVLKKYRPCPLSFFLVFKRNSTILINIPTLRCGHARVFCLKVCTVFCCWVSYAKQIFSGSDRLQYLITAVHEMSAWHPEQSDLLQFIAISHSELNRDQSFR